MRIADVVRERGPLTLAAFMDLALYDSESGYYARAARRSGRAGDFFTSVDVGPLFGELLEIQVAEMAAILQSEVGRVFLDPASTAGGPHKVRPTTGFDLVEAGASNAQLSADILRASRRRDPALYRRIKLHLVETSTKARAAARAALGEVADRLVASTNSLPATFRGVLVANELLDALPVHQVVMRPEGLREIYVDVGDPSRQQRRSDLDTPERSARGPSERKSASEASGGGAPRALIEDARARPPLVTIEGPLSTPALGDYLDRLGVCLQPGWRAEINLHAIDWIRHAARCLERGFIIIIDYGHEARELYSAAHAGGTLTTFARHTSAGPSDAAPTPSWLEQPGEHDITAHVDFTSIRAAAEAEGLTTLGFMDQTYFLLALLETSGRELFSEKDRRALKTLLMPGGLGSTHKVLILGKGVGTPQLRGCSSHMRVT